MKFDYVISMSLEFLLLQGTMLGLFPEHGKFLSSMDGAHWYVLSLYYLGLGPSPDLVAADDDYYHLFDDDYCNLHIIYTPASQLCYISSFFLITSFFPLQHLKIILEN